MQVYIAFFILECVIVAIEGSAMDKFLGKWESTDKRESTPGFAEAVDHVDADSKIFNEFYIQRVRSTGGYEYHHEFSVPDKNYAQHVVFQLGEEGQTTFNGTTYKYKYTLDGDNLKAHFELPNRQVDQEFTLVNNQLVKTYRVNSDTAKVWFKKV